MGLKVKLWTLDHSVSLCGLCSVCWLGNEGFVPGSAGASAVMGTLVDAVCSCAANARGKAGCWLKHNRLVNGPNYNYILQVSTFYPHCVLWFHSSPPYLFSGLKHGINIQINLSRGMTQIGFTFWTRYSIYQVSVIWVNTGLIQCLWSQ